MPTSPFCTDKTLSLQCPEFDFFNRFGQVLRHLKHHYLHCVRFEIIVFVAVAGSDDDSLQFSLAVDEDPPWAIPLEPPPSPLAPGSCTLHVQVRIILSFQSRVQK